MPGYLATVTSFFKNTIEDHVRGCATSSPKVCALREIHGGVSGQGGDRWRFRHPTSNEH
jgi:hypothetical protein